MATKKLQIISGGTAFQSDWNTTDPEDATYIKNKPQLSTVAETGNYNDLLNPPTIDTAPIESSSNAISGGAVYTALASKANSTDLAPVATSGKYTDLIERGHTHSASDINSGVISIAHGGTGASNGATALQNLFSAGATILSSNQYGDNLPKAGTAGRLFLKKKV